MSMPFPPSARIPPAAALSKAALPQRVRDALVAIYTVTFELIVDPLDRLLPELESRLGHPQDRGAQHTIAVSYLDQAQLLQRRQTAFIGSFARHLDEELADLRTLRPAAPETAAPAMPSFHELRLVDEDEADEETEIRAIVLRHESRAALPLQLLCQRFAVLAESPAFELGQLPVGPRRLCELLLEAAREAGLGLTLRIAILREFDRRVLAEYHGVAETLNDMLARRRIMPGLSYVPLRARPRSAAQPVETPAVPDSERPLTGWTALPSTDADSATFQLLQELLSTRRSLADRFRPGSGTGRSRAELDTAQVIDLLEDADPAATHQDFEAVRQWLLLRARQQHGQAMTLSAHDADTFELLGMLYSQLAREVRGGTPATSMLQQLRLPLLKLALNEPAFFVRSAHPARAVLNAVAETGARWQGPDSVDPQLVTQMQRLVDDLARPHADVGGAFRDALQALESQLTGLAKRSEISERRHVEAARGKEKLAIARERSTGVIEDALRDTRLPSFHRNMLRNAWADVLTLAHLRYGDEHADWKALVDATGELVRAGSGQAPSPSGLQPQVEQWLATVGYHAEDAARISRILTATIIDEDDDAATRTELAMRLKARARLGEEAVPEESDLPPRTGIEQAQFERLRTLPFGTWIEFDEPNGDTVRRRLSWLSPVTGNALFVNQRGQRAGEWTLDMLARRLAAGTIRIVTAADGRLVDRAWRAALQSLRSLAGATPSDVDGDSA